MGCELRHKARKDIVIKDLWRFGRGGAHAAGVTTERGRALPGTDKYVHFQWDVFREKASRIERKPAQARPAFEPCSRVKDDRPFTHADATGFVLPPPVYDMDPYQSGS